MFSEFRAPAVGLAKTYLDGMGKKINLNSMCLIFLRQNASNKSSFS